MKRLRIYLLIVVITVINANAQRSTLKLEQVKTLPVIDGKYEDVLSIMQETNFTQLEPQLGFKSSLATKIICLQSDNSIYIGVACYQQVPIVSNIQVRDKFAQSDDGIFLILGTFNDNRNGYAFGLNPTGTQVDFNIIDDGRTIDYNWDTEWKSATSKQDWGWFAEYEIPLKSIRYKNNAEKWQIDFRRIVRSNSEVSYWSGAVTEEFKMSLTGSLTNLKIANQKNKITIVPYAMGISTTTNNDWKNTNYDAQIGGDLNWKINSNLSANATINPDFATVEADEEVIDLTRYEIEFAEKRLFFQEGNEMYDTRLKTFYSRRINDIDGAAKLNGKIGKTNLNFISALENNNTGSDPLYNVLRLKRDVLKSSSIGATFTNKTDAGKNNSSASLDYVLNLGNLWKFTGQYVGVVSDFNKLRNAVYMRFAAENSFFHYHLRYSYFDGDGFKNMFNVSGYTKDDDRQEFDSDIWYKWWIKNDIFKFVKFTSKNNMYWNHDFGLYKGYKFSVLNENYFSNKINVDFQYINEYRLNMSDFKKYYNYTYDATVGYNTEAYNRALFHYQTGRAFGSNFNLYEAEMRLKLFSKFGVEFKPRYIDFNPETSQYKDAMIYGFSGTYNFNNDTWIKLINQYNSATEKFYLYALAGWRFKPPFGNLYVVVTSLSDYFDAKGVAQPSKLVGYIKFTYPIGINL